MTRFSASIPVSVLAAVLVATFAVAQAPPLPAETAPADDVCITVDVARDTLSPHDRAAALLLVAHQFELEGRHVIPLDCSMLYTVSHIRLGNTIVVTLTGPDTRHREGTALGMDDLPALYSQMVRSIVTGKPMAVDRTNVTASQAAPLRVQSDSFVYLRLGHGRNLGGGRGGPIAAFGFRTELDSLGIDVSFLTTQSNSRGPSIGTLMKLQALHFMNPQANASAYAGGGLSYGGSSFGGSGLQGELSIGYEFARSSSLRMFVQADATLPFYKSTFERYADFTGRTIGRDRRWAPVLAVSLGFGWQRNRRAPQ